MITKEDNKFIQINFKLTCCQKRAKEKPNDCMQFILEVPLNDILVPKGVEP